MTFRPPLERFVDYFAELGPRWGIAADTCRAQAALYLHGQPARHGAESVAAPGQLAMSRAGRRETASPA